MTTTAAAAARDISMGKGTPWRRAFDRHVSDPVYRGNVWTSAGVAARTLIYGAAVLGSAAWCRHALGAGGWWWRAAETPPPSSSWAALPMALALPCLFTAAWAAFAVRSFIIFHDCGHKSFVQGFPGASTLNWLAMHVFAVACSTPVDWNVGHGLHHSHVGNAAQDDYDWGETVFHTASGYARLAPWKRRLVRCARHPVPFFILAPALTWWVKMRLPFELRPGRKAAYRLSSKVVNLASMLVKYVLAYRLGIMWVVVLGEYFGMVVGVMLFHMQHVFENGYVKLEASDWHYVDASIRGSSVLTVPEALKWVTLGIEYHHIHHARTRIPGYMLRACHERAPQGLWGAVTVLSYTEMWQSLWLELWDGTGEKYTTFADVERKIAVGTVKRAVEPRGARKEA